MNHSLPLKRLAAHSLCEASEACKGLGPLIHAGCLSLPVILLIPSLVSGHGTEADIGNSSGGEDMSFAAWYANPFGKTLRRLHTGLHACTAGFVHYLPTTATTALHHTSTPAAPLAYQLQLQHTRAEGLAPW
eukprot:1161268-Pelagomonas_calceolata.AAC.14